MRAQGFLSKSSCDVPRVPSCALQEAGLRPHHRSRQTGNRTYARLAPIPHFTCLMIPKGEGVALRLTASVCTDFPVSRFLLRGARSQQAGTYFLLGLSADLTGSPATASSFSSGSPFTTDPDFLPAGSKTGLGQQ